MELEVLQNLGIFTIGAGNVGYVPRFGIKQYFDTELKRYKAELDKEQARFSKLHDERAQVTAELYERFVEFEEDTRKLTSSVG